MSDNRELLRRTFDSAADLYEAARPSYPSELFDDLVELARLEAGAQLLGCATGKATRSFLERGFSVVCVEMARNSRSEHVVTWLASLSTYTSCRSRRLRGSR